MPITRIVRPSEPRVLLDGSPWNHPVGTRVGCGSPTGEPVRLSRSTSTEASRGRRAGPTSLRCPG